MRTFFVNPVTRVRNPKEIVQKNPVQIHFFILDGFFSGGLSPVKEWLGVWNCFFLSGGPNGFFGTQVFGGFDENGENDEAEKKKAYTTTTERKSFGELFWPKRKTFQTGGGYKNPIKKPGTSSVAPIFFGKEKFCAGVGRCMLSFSQRREQSQSGIRKSDINSWAGFCPDTLVSKFCQNDFYPGGYFYHRHTL